MRFGFTVGNGTFGTPSVNEGGVDNWSVGVRLAPVPEPGSVMLLGLALGCAIWRRAASRGTSPLAQPAGSVG